MKWKVSYEHLDDKCTRHPFWKRTSYTDAESRAEAVENVSAMFPPPRYGNFRASKVKQ